jgi:hypothetical protein
MAALLTAQTTNTTSSGVATNGTPCYIEVPNTSVFNGAMLSVQASSVNTTGLYSPVGGLKGTITAPGWLKLELPTGTFVRVIQSNSQTGTSITCNLTPTA